MNNDLYYIQGSVVNAARHSFADPVHDILLVLEFILVLGIQFDWPVLLQIVGIRSRLESVVLDLCLLRIMESLVCAPILHFPKILFLSLSIPHSLSVSKSVIILRMRLITPKIRVLVLFI